MTEFRAEIVASNPRDSSKLGGIRINGGWGIFPRFQRGHDVLWLRARYPLGVQDNEFIDVQGKLLIRQTNRIVEGSVNYRNQDGVGIRCDNHHDGFHLDELRYDVKGHETKVASHPLTLPSDLSSGQDEFRFALHTVLSEVESKYDGQAPL